LNDNIAGEQTSITTPDFDSGQAIESFTATFQLELGPGTSPPADGVAFSFGPGVTPGSSYSETGAGGPQDLVIEFHTWNNGPSTVGGVVYPVNAPAVDISFGGNQIGLVPIPMAQMVDSQFHNVSIQLTRAGKVSVVYLGQIIYTNFLVAGWAPTAGLFNISGRAGGSSEWAEVAQLSITTVLQGAAAAPTIVTPPVSATVNEYGTTNFSVTVDGTAPLSFQWVDNNVDIAGETGTTYTMANISYAENNHQIKVRVSNPANVNGVTSAAAILTVIRGTTPPTVVKANASSDGTQVTVVFSKAVSDTILDMSNFGIDQGVIISYPTRSSDTTVVLYLTAPLPGGQSFTLSIHGVQDTSSTPNTMVPTQVTFRSSLWQVGAVLHKKYTDPTPNNNNGSFASLKNDPRYPNNPDRQDIMTAVEYPANGSGRDANADPGGGGAVTYSDTLECIFTAPTTGDYVFFATGADINDVYLSTDTDPANMVNIAQCSGWTNPRDWMVSQCGTTNGLRSDWYSGNSWPGVGDYSVGNALIHLDKGTNYYMLAFHHRFTWSGPDEFAVTYLISPGANQPASGAAPVLTGSVVGTYLDKAVAAVNLNNLTQVYDGTAKPVSVTTTPLGLNVLTSYNGSPAAPVNVGNYTVIGTIVDVNYQGSATGTLVVGQGTATVNLNNLIQVYDGMAKPVSVTTTPLGLNVLTKYNGSPAAPINAGNYTVIGTIVDINYQGSVTNTLVIGQATATVTLGGLYQAYDGAAKCANVSTTPPGLSVSLTYNGSTTCPSAVGSYAVIGTVNDANYQGSTTNTLTIYAVAPVIVQHPQSQAVESGSNVTLTVVATGTPLNYQWFEDGTALTGATSSTLSFNPVALTNADIYFVVVSNTSGVAVSSNAVLAVRPPGAPILRVDGDLVVGSVSLIGSASVTMESSYANGEVFYTLDGSPPDFGSMIYGGAIVLTTNAVVTALGLDLDTLDSAEAPAVTVNLLPTYDLTLTTNGSGTALANLFPGPYASNTVVTITATPAVGWQFDYWTGDVSGNANPVAVTMDGPRSVQAVFVQVAYPVVATTAGGGSVGVSPEQANYLSNTVVTVTATASNGWTFLGWTGNASDTKNPLSLIVDAPKSLAALFGTSVNTSVIGGGIIELNATNPIPYGTIVRATGVPNYGSYFVLWGNALTGTNNPAEFTVTTTNPVHALFATLPANSAALTVRISGEGDVSVSPTKAYYAAGDSVTLTATPRGTTNLFVSWSGDFTSTANPAILTLNTSKVVTASFSPLVLPPVITSSLTETGLVGTVFSYQITASNNPTSYGASGLPLGLSVNPTNGLLSGTPQSAGSYVVTISASNAGGIGLATLALGIGLPVYPPTIVQSPSDQTVSSGATVTFSVVATGTTPLGYQWRKGGFSLPGATDATLVLANVSGSDAAAYDVVVTNAYGSATSAVAQLTIYDAPAARIFVLPTNGTSGQTIEVSVCLAALGNENALSFSLTFDPSLLSYHGVALSSGVSGGSLLANSSALGAGELGLGISLGTGASFSNTTQEIATVQFSLNPVAATTSAVLGFGDQPTARLVAATNALALASTFQGGNIVITPGDYLGDVFPPGVGDHVLDIRDWVREGRLVAGLETVTNQDEFMRADCAPLADKGDGILTVADWVQVGRFAVGLDPVTVVGGPIATNNLVTRLVKVVPYGLTPNAPTIWVSSTSVLAGASVQLPVFLDAVGNENAAGFSVSFDPTQLKLTSVAAGSGAGNATFLANTNGAAQGQVGVVVSLSSGGAWGEGSQELAVLGFKANAGDSGAVPVNLSDTVVRRDVADATAQSLTAVYNNGVISIITSPPQLSIAMVGTNVILSWPAALSNYVLQSVGNLGAGGWKANLGSPSANGTNLFINLPATNLQQFYRLSQ
jgi:hypothetical protein